MGTITALICDDNEAVHESLTSYFSTVDIDIISVYNGPDAIEAVKTRKPDIMILDIMMPKMSGTEVCKAVRKISELPIIILSAKGEEIDRILGLELGADDYITKPFSPREVATRVFVILKRVAVKERGSLLTFQELSMNVEASQVWVDGRKINLTLKEKAIVELLLSKPGVALSRNQIMDAVWGKNYFGDARSVDTFIKRIRQKLPDEGVHFEIASVYGLGYKLEARND